MKKRILAKARKLFSIKSNLKPKLIYLIPLAIVIFLGAGLVGYQVKVLNDNAMLTANASPTPIATASATPKVEEYVDISIPMKSGVYSCKKSSEQEIIQVMSTIEKAKNDFEACMQRTKTLEVCRSECNSNTDVTCVVTCIEKKQKPCIANDRRQENNSKLEKLFEENCLSPEVQDLLRMLPKLYPDSDVFSVTKAYGNFVDVSAGSSKGGGGWGLTAMYKNGKWEIIWKGNGDHYPNECQDLVKKYNIPKEFRDCGWTPTQIPRPTSAPASSEVTLYWCITDSLNPVKYSCQNDKITQIYAIAQECPGKLNKNQCSDDRNWQYILCKQPCDDSYYGCIQECGGSSTACINKCMPSRSTCVDNCISVRDNTKCPTNEEINNQVKQPLIDLLNNYCKKI